MMGATLFLVTIDHRHDTNHSLHRTRGDAAAEVADWVDQWWEREMGGEPKPEVIDGEAIERYFATVEDESAAIEAIEVEGGKLGLHLEIPASAFQPTADPYKPDGMREDDHLLATVTICGVDFHVDAFAVRMVKGVQTASQYDEDLGDLHRIVGAEGPFQTVTIRRRNYVLVLTPYS
jgi:hypothetical protein